MFRKSLTPLLAATFLVAPAVLPSAFVYAMAPGLSGSAQARSNLTTGGLCKTMGPRKGNTKCVGRNNVHSSRMGGGGGVRGGGAARMGGGGGVSTK